MSHMSREKELKDYPVVRERSRERSFGMLSGETYDPDRDIRERQKVLEAKYRAAGLWGGPHEIESYASDLVDIQFGDE